MARKAAVRASAIRRQALPDISTVARPVLVSVRRRLRLVMVGEL